jgi:hypothetical protein
MIKQGLRNAKRGIKPLVAAVGGGVLLWSGGETGAMPPNVVRWSIEATVIDVADPDQAFPDVRVGDPVRGLLKYDVDLFPDPFLYDADHFATYPNDVWFGVVTMIIENPRNGTEQHFARNPDGCCADVDIANDNDFYADEPLDALVAYQSVLPPPGYVGVEPVVDVALFGPTDVLASVELLSALDLDDWPDATISFDDFFDVTGEAGHITAEIYALTPLSTPRLVGDFDYDDDVDGNDLFAWKPYLGSSSIIYADADEDLDVDGADLLIWQRQVGMMTPSFDQVISVPESHGVFSVVAAVVTTLLCRRGR